MVNIILNADDFGKSVERNRAVNDCFQQDLISSAGLIVTGKHLPEAVDYIKKGGYADKIHLHFNLSASLLHEDPGDVPLTDAMKKDPFFCESDRFKKYRGLPKSISSIRKWKIVYNELIAQYEKFIEVTDGKADYKHVDFHLWYNLTWPVSVALNLFTRKYKIKSVRYIGVHQKNMAKYKRLRIFPIVSWNSSVGIVPATNIDYYLSERDSFKGIDIVELYCHPNYKDGILLDDSPSYLSHDRQPLLKHIELLKDTDIINLLSWNEL